MLITRQLVCQCSNSFKLLRATGLIYNYHTIRPIGDDLKGKFLKVFAPDKPQFQQNVRHKYSPSNNKSSSSSNNDEDEVSNVLNNSFLVKMELEVIFTICLFHYYNKLIDKIRL
jgi:hypothetical protein